MKIAGTVILYHPPIEVVQHIQTYAGFLNQLYVYDNSDFKNEVLIQQILSTNKNITYIYNQANKGISYCLNQAAMKAIDDEHDWLLTMDQDSYFDADQARNYFSYHQQNMATNNSVAVLSLPYGNKGKTVNASIPSVQHVTHAITSGSLINLSLFKEIGGFDEKLFIDEVDFDYCYKARIKGYEILQFYSAVLAHQLGIIKEAGYFKHFKKSSRIIHSPKRVYYMVRNHLYIYQKYKGFFLEELREKRKQLWVTIKNNLFFSGSFFNNLIAIIKGYIDFKKGRMS